MPRAISMSWEGPPNYRWVKMYKGVRYRVTCDELKAMVYTKEATTKAANEWWRKKLAELNGLHGERGVLEAQRPQYGDLCEKVMDGKIAARIVSALDSITGEKFGETREDVTEEEIRAAVEIVLGRKVADQQQRLADLKERVRQVVPQAKTADDRTLSSCVTKFLAVVQGEIRPASYRELRNALRLMLSSSAGLLTKDMDVACLDEGKCRSVYLWLKTAALADSTRAKRWEFFRRLVRFCYGERLIELPRNLEQMGFTVRAKRIKTHSISEVRETLESLPGRLKLFALLGLNCGCTSADMGQLTKDMVDLDTARLVRKRVKTVDVVNVPTVDYQLWPETVELLRMYWSDHPTLVLTSQEGTPLYRSSQEGDRTPTTDLVYQQYRRAGVNIGVKEWRAIAATLIEGHENYGRYKTHFLGHAPRTTADAHYAAPSGELFDRIMQWLRVQVLGDPGIAGPAVDTA